MLKLFRLWYGNALAACWAVLGWEAPRPNHPPMAHSMTEMINVLHLNENTSFCTFVKYSAYGSLYWSQKQENHILNPKVITLEISSLADTHDHLLASFIINLHLEAGVIQIWSGEYFSYYYLNYLCRVPYDLVFFLFPQCSFHQSNLLKHNKITCSPYYHLMSFFKLRRM